MFSFLSDTGFEPGTSRSGRIETPTGRLDQSGFPIGRLRRVIAVLQVFPLEIYFLYKHFVRLKAIQLGLVVCVVQLKRSYTYLRKGNNATFDRIHS